MGPFTLFGVTLNPVKGHIKGFFFNFVFIGTKLANLLIVQIAMSLLSKGLVTKHKFS